MIHIPILALYKEVLFQILTRSKKISTRHGILSKLTDVLEQPLTGRPAGHGLDCLHGGVHPPLIMIIIIIYSSSANNYSKLTN